MRGANRTTPLLAASLAAALFTAGCTDDETYPIDTTESCGPGKTRSFVISSLGFTRVDEETGHAPGFDVDGVVSDGSDPGSCFKEDFVDPDGAVGVDNQLAVFVPELEMLLGDAVDGLVQGAINNGELLILLSVDGAEDLRDDACVDLTVQTGIGKPTLGTDGVIEAYQTYDADPKSEVSHAHGGRVEDGVLTIGPFELAVPIAIFDVAFTLHVHDARVRLVVDAENGVKGGYLGGGVVPQEVIDGVKDGAGVAQYIGILGVVLHQSADLDADAEGTCQQISGAFQIEAVEAFIRP